MEVVHKFHNITLSVLCEKNFAVIRVLWVGTWKFQAVLTAFYFRDSHPQVFELFLYRTCGGSSVDHILIGDITFHFCASVLIIWDL